MESAEIRSRTEPFYSLFDLTFFDGFHNGMEAIRIMGHVRRGERANVMHACMRESLRVVCEIADPILTLIEEPDGQALDALLVTMDGESHALRWGRYDAASGRFNRNATTRTSDMQGQQFMWGECFDPSGVPTATIGYEIADDFTEAGQPQWWLERLALRRERTDRTEFIAEIVTYDVPVRLCDVPDPRTVEFIADQHQRRDELEQATHQIISNIA